MCQYNNLSKSLEANSNLRRPDCISVCSVLGLVLHDRYGLINELIPNRWNIYAHLRPQMF